MLRRPSAHDDLLAAMSRRSRFFAWMLVVAVVLVWSSTAGAVCSLRPLATANGDDARGDDEPCAAGGVVAPVSSGSVGGEASSRSQREIWNRRSLGDRSLWSSPPSPLWNTPRTMPVPPPPLV